MYQYVHSFQGFIKLQVFSLLYTVFYILTYVILTYGGEISNQYQYVLCLKSSISFW